MRAYILSRGRTIAPFGDPVSELPIHETTLGQHQARLLAAAGHACERIETLEQIREFPCLVVEDELYFTAQALHNFVRAAQQGWESAPEENYQAALVASLLTEHHYPGFLEPVRDLRDGPPARPYGLFALCRLDSAIPLADQSQLLAIPHRFRTEKARVSPWFADKGIFQFPVSTVALYPVRHWSSLLAANQLGFYDFFLGQLRRRWGHVLTWPVRLPLRAGSLRPSLLRGKMYLAGRRCKIHPTAQLEGCVLGDNVRVGPNAILKYCVLGSQTQIGAAAIVEGCNFGPRTVVNAQVVLRGCVGFDDSAFGTMLTQLTVVGRGAVLCPISKPYDFHLLRTIKVHADQRSYDTGSRFLGICLGHRAFLGPEVNVTFGQAIPNDCVLVINPHAVLRNLRKLPPHIVRVDNFGAAADDHLSDAA